MVVVAVVVVVVRETWQERGGGGGGRVDEEHRGRRKHHYHHDHDRRVHGHPTSVWKIGKEEHVVVGCRRPSRADTRRYGSAEAHQSSDIVD